MGHYQDCPLMTQCLINCSEVENSGDNNNNNGRASFLYFGATGNSLEEHAEGERS